VWRATLKSLLARKLRLALTALAVILGVGFVVGTLILTDTLGRAFDQAFAGTSEGTDVVVRGASAFEPGFADPGGGVFEEQPPVPDGLLDRIEDVDGVATAAGELAGYAQLINPDTGEPITTAGSPAIGLASRSSWSARPEGSRSRAPSVSVIWMTSAGAH
jgi:putative ABC transport system permease protein